MVKHPVAFWVVVGFVAPAPDGESVLAVTGFVDDAGVIDGFVGEAVVKPTVAVVEGDFDGVDASVTEFG